METRIAGRAYLAGVARDASLGSLRLQCPFCDGGPDREVSLVLTIREDGSFYCCHRASCGAKGIVGERGRAISLGARESKQPAEKPLDPYTGGLEEMGVNLFITDRFNRAPMGPLVEYPKDIGLYTDQYGDKEVWRLQDRFGARIGIQTRWRENGKKVVKLYKETQWPVCHWLERSMADMWIVEDPLSAGVVYSHGKTGLALVGTYLQPQLAAAIAYATVPRIVVALDPGAEEAAKRAAQTLRSVVSCPVLVVPLRTDIKDMTPSAVHHLLHWGDL